MIVTGTHRYRVKEPRDASTKLAVAFLCGVFLRDCVANGYCCRS